MLLIIDKILAVLIHLFYCKQLYSRSQELELTSTFIKEYQDIFLLLYVRQESQQILMSTLESILRSDYPKSKIHVVMAFDEDSEGLEYIEILKKLHLYRGVLDKKYAETQLDGMNVYATKFYYSGKRATQKHCIELVRRNFGQDQKISQDPVLLFMESDVILERQTLATAIRLFQEEPEYVALYGTRSFPNSLFGFFNIVEVIQKLIFGMHLTYIGLERHLKRLNRTFCCDQFKPNLIPYEVCEILTSIQYP
jgi:cellulose synthase/poly-beta-1,6-N-acetylglucosamine synthase-like glycosyltransferase